MERTEHKLTLDVHKPVSATSICVKKGDTAHRLMINLAEGGYPYHIAEGCTAVFSATKPDGKTIFNNCTIDGDVIIYDMTDQTTSATGVVNCEIQIHDANGDLLTSATFYIIVDDRVSNGSAVVSSDEFTLLTAMIHSAGSATTGAYIAANRADMAAAACGVIGSASGNIIHLDDAIDSKFVGMRIFGKGSSGSIGVTVNGKNIFEYIGKPQIENGSIIESSAVGGTFQGSDGTMPGSTQWSSGWAHFDRANPLYLKAGTVITVSADYTVLEKHASAKEKISIHFASHSGSASMDIRNAEIGVKYRISRTLTVPEDGSYTRTTFTIHSSKVKIENVQWEIGDVSSDFVQYKGQTITIPTPNGLHGIPISSGGNYADEDGQQWLCDEIDLAKGKIIRRVDRPLEEPEETDLPDEVIDDFQAYIRSRSGDTVVSNDAGAHMALEYIMDARKYIDKMISTGIHEATLE